MKKVLLGLLMLQVTILEPVIGYYVFSMWLQVPDTPLYISCGALIVFMIIQFFTYGSLLVAVFKEMKIEHTFHGSNDRKQINGT
jgi:hypothetical protein